MSSVLSPDSKLMKTIELIGDLVFTNFLYVLLCLPIFTIGAAQSGMCQAMRAFSKKEKEKREEKKHAVTEDDEPKQPEENDIYALVERSKGSSKDLISGFKNGFGKVTALWSIYFVLLLLLFYAATYLFITTGDPFSPIALVAYLGMFIVTLLQTQLPLLHSMFDCSFKQLYQNSVFICLKNPIRSVIIAALVNGPFLVLIFATYYFMYLTPAWAFVYYSFAFLISTSLMQPVYDRIIKKNEDDERIARELEERRNKSI